MGTAFYTQHELTDEEIERDRRKAAAIARNRATGAVKRKRHDVNNVTIVHVNDSVSDAQKDLIVALLKDLSAVDEQTWLQAAHWWLGGAGVEGAVQTANKALASQTIARLKTRITEAKRRTTPPSVRQEAASARTGATIASMRPASRDRFADVPDGYYAIEYVELGKIDFFRVSTWPSGDRKVQVQASDALHRIPGNKAVDTFLTKIREITPPVAGKLYADQLGNCMPTSWETAGGVVAH